MNSNSKIKLDGDYTLNSLLEYSAKLAVCDLNIDEYNDIVIHFPMLLVKEHNRCFVDKIELSACQALDNFSEFSFSGNIEIKRKSHQEYTGFVNEHNKGVEYAAY